MLRHNLWLVATFICICFVFCGAVVYSVRIARGDTVAAHQAAAQFYAHLQQHDYEGAQSMLTRERRSVITRATIATYMARFEKKHGPLAKTQIAETPTVYGNRVSIFPRYVEESRLMTGTGGSNGAGMLHLQPEDGTWKIGRLSIVP